MTLISRSLDLDLKVIQVGGDGTAQNFRPVSGHEYELLPYRGTGDKAFKKNFNQLEQCFQRKTYVPPPVWTDILLK